jgi:hypothetical protein
MMQGWGQACISALLHVIGMGSHMKSEVKA